MSFFSHIVKILLVIIFVTAILLSIFLKQSTFPGPLNTNTIIQYQTWLKQDDSFSHISYLEIYSLKYPYDLEVDQQLATYTGIDDGSIKRIDKMDMTTFHRSRGKILGLKFFNDYKEMVFIDQARGVCKLDVITNESVVLTDSYNERKFNSLSSIDVGLDGKIYFTDSSSEHQGHDKEKQFLIGLPYGRVFVHDLTTGITTLLMSGLYYPTGIAVSLDNTFLTVSQSFRYRVLKIQLNNLSQTILIENLPGFPQNLKYNDRGQLWIALPTYRTTFFLRLVHYMAQNPKLRAIMMLLPKQWLRNIFSRSYHSGGIKINDKTGQIIRVLRGRNRGPHFTSIIEKKKTLYFVDNVKKAMASLKLAFLQVDD